MVCDIEPVLVGELDTVLVLLLDFVFETEPVDVFDIWLLKEFVGENVFIGDTVYITEFVANDVNELKTELVLVELDVDVKLPVTVVVRVFVLEEVTDAVVVGVVDIVLVNITELVGVNVPIATVFVTIGVGVPDTDTVDVLLAPDDFVFVNVLNIENVNLGV